MLLHVKQMLKFILGGIPTEVDFRLGKKQPGNWLLIIGGLLVLVSMRFRSMSMLLILMPMLMVYLYEPFFRTRLNDDTAVRILPYRPETLLAGAASPHYRRVARDSLILLIAVLGWFFAPMIGELITSLRTGQSVDLTPFSLWGSILLVFALSSFWIVLAAFAAPASLLLAGGVRPLYSLLAGVMLVYAVVVSMNIVSFPMEEAEEHDVRDTRHVLPSTFTAEARPLAERLASPFYFMEVGRSTFTSGTNRWGGWLVLLLVFSLAASLTGQGAAHWLFRARSRE